MENQEIINSWTLQAFCQANGNPKFATLANKSTGETFNTLMFKNGEKMVSFSSKLIEDGKDTIAYVKNNKDDLNIIQLESGSYKLCKRANSAWQDLNLF